MNTTERLSKLDKSQFFAKRDKCVQLQKEYEILLKEYKSEQEIINQLKSNNGDWFKSNNNKTNYIEHEWLSKYNPKKDITKYVACYDK